MPSEKYSNSPSPSTDAMARAHLPISPQLLEQKYFRYSEEIFEYGEKKYLFETIYHTDFDPSILF